MSSRGRSMTRNVRRRVYASPSARRSASLMSRSTRRKSRSVSSVRSAPSRSITLSNRSYGSLDRHAFSRYSEAGEISCSTTSASADYVFKLTDVINYSEFTTLFDQYKILKVVFKIQMITNPDSANPLNVAASSTTTYYNNPTNWFPKFWYIRDYDSGSSETISSIKERQGAKFFVMKPNKEYSIALKPMVQVQTYKTSVSTGYAPKRLWLDIADTSVPHYGLKTVIDCLGLDPNDTYPFKFRYETKFYLGFKGVR